MIPYQSKVYLIAGSSLDEILIKVRGAYGSIRRKTKRRAYIRSAYFKKEKVFFDYFWIHLSQKNRKTKTIRLKYFLAAIDLIENNRQTPITKENPLKRSELLHRFYGSTKEKHLFCIQIKQEKKTGRKYFMSVFPIEQKDFPR